MRSLEHQYAEVALRSMKEILGLQNKEKIDISRDEYERICLTFAGLVMLNGLRSTVGYFRTKGRAHDKFLEHIGDAIGAKLIEQQFPVGTAYRSMSLRVLRASTWFKRYAITMLKVDSD